MSLSQDVAKLEQRLRQAEDIIAAAYRHAASASQSGELAHAICKPLLEILTMPLEAMDDEERRA